MPEKDYVAIAKKRITKPTVVDRKRKILIYGRMKKGKSYFCTTAPNILILDPEHGTDTMTQKNPDVWHIEKWEDLDEAYRFLRLGKHNYEWVALDGLTRIHNMALKWVMRQAEERDLDRRPGTITKQDHGKAGEMSKDLLVNFHNLNIGVIYTAQERMVELGGEDETEDMAFVADLPAGVRAMANSVVDVIGRIYVTKAKVRRQGKIVEVVQRRLWITPHERYDTGFRSDFDLPEFIKNPTISKLVSLMLTGEEQ